jgi:hypothetical protein
MMEGWEGSHMVEGGETPGSKSDLTALADFTDFAALRKVPEANPLHAGAILGLWRLCNRIQAPCNIF